MRSMSPPACLVASGLMWMSGCVIDRGPLPSRDDAGARDAGPDAQSLDASGDAYGLDAFSPDTAVDAGLDAHFPEDVGIAEDVTDPPDVLMPPDAWAPDAWAPDAWAPDAWAPDAFSPDAWAPDAFTPECAEGATRCTPAGLDRCTGGRWAFEASCPLGCDTSARDPAPHCLRLNPSNVPATEMRGGPDVVIGTGLTAAFDTDACSSPAAPDALRSVGGYCVASLGSLTVDAGAVLTVRGAAPLIVLVTGNVTFAGRLDASAVGAVTRGPGERSTGTSVGGAGNDTGVYDTGGGGGGHCGAGGPGGDAPGMSGPGRGGDGSTASLLSPLRGGSPGGRGSGQDGLRGAGGRGGGAVQISTRGTLLMNGQILVTGGGGGGGLRTGTSAASAGGGGSGGAVLLEGATITYGADARIDVRGGGGGSGACHDATTSADENGQSGQNGQDAEPLARPAGGAARSCSLPGYSSGAGGRAAGAMALDGEPGSNGDNAGGGGGGAGCVAARSVNRAVPRTLPDLDTVRATELPLVD